MNGQVEMMETTIPKGRTVRIQGGKGVDLTVLAGSLWVTHEHDTADIVLDPSDNRLHLSRNGLTLIHAFRDVRLRIAYPADAAAPSLTFGGGRRELGASVWGGVVREWMGTMRAAFGSVQGGRVRPAAVR